MRHALFTFILLTATALSGCDLFGGESAEKAAAAREAEGKAIGGACRHAGRAIEDCYSLNKKAEKAAVFAGWRDMNDYMRENKIEPVAPTMVATVKPDVKEPKASKAEGAEKKPAVVVSEGAEASEKKPAKPPKATDKSHDSKAHES